MTMRLDIVTNDAGELVRREHARELGANVVISLYRLVRLAQIHDSSNQAFVRQLELTHQTIADYCLRAGSNVNVLFAQKAVFVAGQLLKGSHEKYDAATELGEIFERCGGSELTIARDVTQAELLGLAEGVSGVMKGRAFRAPSPKIRLRAVNEAARMRGLEVEDLADEQRIVRNYASAVVILRRFFDDLAASRYVLPRRIKRVAQNLVDLSAGATPAFLGVTEARNANHDDAGRAVNTAILAVAMAREITTDRATLVQIAMAAMMHDVGRPRAAALAAAGGPRVSQLVARLTEDAEDRLPAGTAAVLTALGRVNEPSITRTVLAFEALWVRRSQYLGPVYRGARAATLHARIIAVARRYNDLLTPEPGVTPPPPDFAVGTIAEEITEPADRTVLRMLVAALGLFPVGTVVQLSSGEVAEVIFGPDAQTTPGKPRLRVVMDANGAVLPAPVEIDLASPKPGDARKIARVMSVDGWRKGLDGKPVLRARQTQEPSIPSRSAVVATEPRIPIAPPAPSSFPPAATPTPAPPPVPTVAPPRPEMRARAASIPDVPPLPKTPAPPPPPKAPALPKEWTITDKDEPRAAPPPGALASGPFTPTDMKAAPPISDRPSLVPTARGTLATTPLAHVLVYMLDHALTGSVVFAEPEGDEHVIYFQLGSASKVRIARPAALLGDELVAAGVLRRDVLPEAVEGARRLGVLLGEYLVGHDLVTREALARALEAQVGNKVASIVNLAPDTTYSFYRDVDLLASIDTEGAVTEPLNVILATVRTWHDRARIRATLSRITKHPLIFHPQFDASTLTLPEDERAVLDTIRAEGCTLGQLFAKRLADDEAVSSLVYTFAVTRQFAFKGQKKPPMGGRGAALPISIAPPASSVGAMSVAPAMTLPPASRRMADTAASAPSPPPSPPPSLRGPLPPPSLARPSPPPSMPRPSPTPSDAALTLAPPPPPPDELRMSEPPAPARASIAPHATWRPPPPNTLPPELAEQARNSLPPEEIGGVEGQLEAMTHFRLAESALHRGDVALAERLARKAAAGDPEHGDYLALYTWIRAMGTHSEGGIVEAILTLNKIIDAQESDRALLYRGKLFKRIKKVREALRDFQRVLARNPNHREAASEVRLIRQSRGGK